MDLVVDEVIAAPRGRLTMLASSAAGSDAIEISRYDRNGARDPSFGGGDGRVALSQRLFGEPCAVSAADAAFQPDGRRGARIARFGGLREFAWFTAAIGDGFAVVGVTRQTASRHDFAVARFAGP